MRAHASREQHAYGLRDLAGYPAIGSLGAVGDGHSLALVGPGGEVEWFCPKRFDAPPLIWPLLDRRRGGVLRIGPAGPATMKTRYVGDTAVLEQEWKGAHGSAVAHLAMGWPVRDGRQGLFWVVRGLAGEIDVEVRFAPQPAFGREPFELRLAEAGAQLVAAPYRLTLASPFPLAISPAEVRGRGPVRAGETRVFCLYGSLQEGQDPPPLPLGPERAAEMVEQTIRAWRAWASGIEWEGPYREEIVRSAITLKLLIYEPTGAVVAAGTTSLPEVLGGDRNWDYRYAWLRDASFTLNALYQLGCRGEASRWAEWMCRATAEHGLPVRVLYGVGGETRFPEVEIEEADGYRGSRPVRVGNAAEEQVQLDVYGEILDCLAICETMGDAVMRREWPHLRRLADFVADHWREPDSGIWEVRDRPRQFVHSKVMAWVALSRAVELSHRCGLEGDAERWRQEAEAIRRDVHERGLVAGRGYFGRVYREDALDASLLLLPVVGFLDGRDPAVSATVQAVRERLSPPGAKSRALLARYSHDAGDGPSGKEGAFTICGFWLVEALALAGQREEAEELFRELVSLGGALGLFAEEVDPGTGEQLGNFPQAFTHVGLINAALRLRDRSAKSEPVDGHLRPAGRRRA